MHPDSQLPTDAQRQKLSEMMYHAFLEIRLLSWNGQAQQAADLADAFHNLPVMMWSESCSLGFFRKAFVAAYHEKYAPAQRWEYLRAIDEVIAMRRG